MTVAAMEALDWLEGWLLQYRTVTPIRFWDHAPEALEKIDVIREAFPAMPQRSEAESMLICAVRYAQGRMSYVVSEACGWVRSKWPTLTDGTRVVIWRDLKHFLNRGETCPQALGMDIDAHGGGESLPRGSNSRGRRPHDQGPLPQQGRARAS